MSVDSRRSLAKNLILRAKIIQSVRNFFISKGFLEVETPVRIPAPAPEPYIFPVESENWYLHTSPELCMKRLLCAGYERIFQICKCFRGHERGARHLPEFTMLEWYESSATYADLMKRCEQLVDFICQELHLSHRVIYQGAEINLEGPWPAISVQEAFKQFASADMLQALAQDCFDEILSLQIEPRLGFPQPVFLYDYPAERSPLAEICPQHPGLSQRMELYVAGLEICNGFTELTDPNEQRRRFEHVLAGCKHHGAVLYPMPEKFLSDLAHMPPSAGNALGIDRLVMIFTNAASIDEVVAFTPEDL